MEDHQATTEGGTGRPADEPDERGTPPIPVPEPPADDEPKGEAPALPKGRIRIPDDTRGHYVVLWAVKPPRGQRPVYEEVACIATHDVASAKRKVLDDISTGAFLKARAAEKPGILLRAVPAMHWPQDVEPTTYVRPEPILQIG